jgi:MurNAc alpha-1-phosphate uridylyltransferase
MTPPTHAMILAAGLGTRMRPLTNTLPKPLIPLAGKPLIDWCLDWLLAAGITRAVINSSYLAEMLEAHVQARVQPQITVSREGSPPLETGGGIAKALPYLGDAPFLVMNSDAVFPATSPHPVHQLAEAWSDDADFLMLLVPVSRAIGWQGGGDFVLEEGGRIRRPEAGEIAPYVFTGVELVHPRAFAGCPQGAFSLSTLWNRHRDARGVYTRVRAMVHTGDWLNVGDLAGLAAAEDYSRGGGVIGKRI